MRRNDTEGPDIYYKFCTRERRYRLRSPYLGMRFLVISSGYGRLIPKEHYLFIYITPLVGNTETPSDSPLCEAYPHTARPHRRSAEGDSEKILPCWDYKRLRPSVPHHLLRQLEDDLGTVSDSEQTPETYISSEEMMGTKRRRKKKANQLLRGFGSTAMG